MGGVADYEFDDRDTLMRMAAFERVRRLGEVRDHLAANGLKLGLIFESEAHNTVPGHNALRFERLKAVA